MMNLKMGSRMSGQIVVLVLLLSLMGLTIGLSQISRSLSDLKQVTYVDTGTKAFAGAEAGLQFALSDLTTKINSGQQISIEDCAVEIPIKEVLNLGNNFSGVTYNICPNIASYVYYPGVLSDEVREIDLSKISTTGITGVDIAWNNPTNVNTGLEVIVIDGDYNLVRRAYNAVNSTLNSSFNSSVAINATNCNNDKIAAGSCVLNIPVNSTQKLLRIKPLAGVDNGGGATDILVKVAGTGNLGPVTYTITATATTKNQTTKKLQIIKIPPAMPGIFDNAFYSGGSITKN